MSDKDYARQFMQEAARRIAKLEKDLKATSRAPADLRHSAIDGGQTVVKDANGNITYRIGVDPETGLTVPQYPSGPKPPKPDVPSVDLGGETVKVQLSGLDFFGDPAPEDLKATEVHLGREVDFEPSLATLATFVQDPMGSVSHRIYGGLWYVRIVWVTLSNQRSDPSDAVEADVEPLVNTDDIEEALGEAQERLDEYTETIAKPRFEALETGLGENAENLSAAEKRIDTAEGILSPLPGRIEAAEQDVESAKEAAVEAGAAAVEANNRAMTRLANGNFENGLDYWTGVNVSVSDTAHSGVQAASLDHGGGHLSPESSFPVVPDQIWELSLYYRGDVTVAFQSVEADARSTLESFDLDGDATWADSGALRVTVPAGVDMLSFTIAGEDALVDDITLRDVTDVVRLEEAANANRRAAEDALAEATLIRFAVEGEDGESGLKGELRAAQATLAEKADQSELPALETRLSEAFGADISTALDTAAADATAKANAAQTAAETKAQELAEAEASAAQSAAEAAAAQDALEKANAARDAAIESSSGDATAKADAAREAAEEYAEAEAQAKADAAQAEAIRQAKLDATEKADAAQAAAEQAAKDHADALPKVLHGTGAPAGTAPDGSIWWQHQGALSGPVIGQWNRVNGQWRSTPIDSEAIANLDVGKLTAGSAEIAEAVIDLLWARVVRAGLLEADEALIGRTLIADGAVTAEKITATREMITKIFGAEWAYIAERLVVDGEIITQNIDAINAAIEQLTVTERADFAKAFAQEMWAELGVFDKLQAQEAWIGGALIKDDAITVGKLTGLESIMSALGEFLKVRAGQIEANAFEGETYIGGTFQGTRFETHSEPDRGVKLTENGLLTYQIDGVQTFRANAHDGSVDMTGWVRSRVSGRPEVAVLGVSELANRPGLMLDTGTTDGAQPTIFSTANSVLGIPAGTLYLTSREKNLNSSGRATLLLGEGGGFSLSSSFGPNAGTGLHTNNGQVVLRGYSREAYHADQNFKSGQTVTSTSNADTIAFDVVFGAPAPRGTHIATASTYSAMSTGHRTGSAGVTTASASKLRLILGNREPSATGTWSIYWMAQWIV